MGRVCLVTGLPAAGKTTLCARLAQLLDHTVHVDCDTIVGTCDHTTTTYKQRRLQLLSHLRHLLTCSHSTSTNILIDDCMWLGSMRKAVRKLCADGGHAFGVVWVEVRPEVAVERDRMRVGRVGEETVWRVWERAEVPRDALIVSADNICVESILEYINRLTVIVPNVPEKKADVSYTPNHKHQMNLELCKLAGELIRDGFDQQIVCRAKKTMLQSYTGNVDLKELFIQECQRLMDSNYTGIGV